jgi:hypothetical protein
LSKSQLYAAFQCASRQSLFDALSKGFSLNGFSYYIKDGNLNCSAKLVNNLPVLFYFTAPENASSLKVTYKVPVAPLKPLIEDAIRLILTR